MEMSSAKVLCLGKRSDPLNGKIMGIVEEHSGNRLADLDQA
jgi:hypothetical protein